MSQSTLVSFSFALVFLSSCTAQSGVEVSNPPVAMSAQHAMWDFTAVDPTHYSTLREAGEAMVQLATKVTDLEKTVDSFQPMRFTRAKTEIKTWATDAVTIWDGISSGDLGVSMAANSEEDIRRSRVFGVVAKQLTFDAQTVSIFGNLYLADFADRVATSAPSVEQLRTLTAERDVHDRSGDRNKFEWSHEAERLQTKIDKVVTKLLAQHTADLLTARAREIEEFLAATTDVASSSR